MCVDHNARPTTLPANYGMHVSGLGFWPRPREVCDLVHGLAAGESFTMFGLRRIGKSSVMAEVRRLLPQQGAIVVHVDAQSFSGLAGLFGAVLRGLPEQGFRDRLREGAFASIGIAERLKSKLQALVGNGGNELEEADEADLLAFWSVIAPAVGERLAASPRPFVLCIDELPMLFEKMLKRPTGVETVNRLLAGLNQWRGHARVAMYLTGSTGMRGLVKAHGLDGSVTRDMTDVPLPPLPRDEALAMLRALLAGANGVLRWDEPTIEAVLDQLVEFHPSIIQFAFRRLRSARAQEMASIERAFRNDIRPGIETNFYAQFTDRLRAYPQPLRGRLDRALAIVAASDPPIALAVFTEAFTAKDPAEEMEDIIDILREDGFLLWDSEARTLALADRMVRAWWRSRPRA